MIRKKIYLFGSWLDFNQEFGAEIALSQCHVILGNRKHSLVSFVHRGQGKTG